MRQIFGTKYFSKKPSITTQFVPKKDHLLFMDQVSTFVIEYIEYSNNNIMSNYVNVF